MSRFRPPLSHPLLLLSPLLLLFSSVRCAVVHVNLSTSHPISPLLYGANFASSNLLSWGVGVNRNGGNAMSNWNWQLDATNAGSDWYFLSNPQSSSFPSGSTNDLQMDATLAAHSTYVTQVSAIGWVTGTRQKVWSFSVAHYGPQQSNECVGDGGASYCAADAGNGVLADGTVLYNNRTWYQPYTPTDAVSFVQHMRQRATPAIFDPSIIVQLDNEPDIWHSTHRDCHPTAVTYDELWNYTVSYSTALKATYPGIRVAGPIWCCWCAYFWSAKDGCGGGADMAAHDNMYITPWLLMKLNDHYLTHGVQLLDFIDLHYYPNVPDDDSTQARQQQFTDQVRSFYDATYPDPGWIGVSGCGASCNGPYVTLLPRFQQWIAQYAPNLTLGLAVSEYSFGADSMFSPMLANAEVLAVMGSRGVAYSSRWTSPTDGSLAENAFKLYLNYDGSGSKVMGASVPTSSSTAPQLTAYSVHNSTTQTLFVLLFNLAFSADSAVSVTISSASLVSGAASVAASVWQMSAASTALSQQAAVTMTNGGSGGLSFSGYSVPARSATLLVVKGVAQTAPIPSSQSSSSTARASYSSSSSLPSSSTPPSATSSPSAPVASASSSVSSSSSSSSPSPTSPSSTILSSSLSATAALSSSAAAPLSTPSSTATSQTSANHAAAPFSTRAWMAVSLVLTACLASIDGLVV